MDLKSLATTIMKNRIVDDNGDKVNWLKIKVMRYKKFTQQVYNLNTTASMTNSK